jgi:Ni/Co efflux regulator RcnB
MNTITRTIGQITLACIACASLGLAQAQPRDQREQREQRDQRSQRDYREQRDQRDHRDQRSPRGQWDQRGDGRHPQMQRPQPPGVAQRPQWAPPHDRPMAGPAWRGAGPDHNWQRGGRLPPAYRSYHYVVDDWRLHRLPPPPRGYHWVQYGGDYLLVAIATGVILQIILSY